MCPAELVVLTVVGAAVARFAGVGRIPPPIAQVEQSRDLRFEDRADGAVLVSEAATRQPVSVLGTGHDNFIRGVLRGLARDRRIRGLGDKEAFRITRWSDGRLTLTDMSTQRRIELEAFGSTNTESFARLLNDKAGQ